MKLTKAQYHELSMVAFADGYYRAVMGWLRRKGLVERLPCSNPKWVYGITDAGRAALATAKENRRG